MTWERLRLAIIVLGFMVGGVTAYSQPQTLAPEGGNTWKFAVSGDSRNCGNVIMPSIAASAAENVQDRELKERRATTARA